MKLTTYSVLMAGIFFLSCKNDSINNKRIQLITLDPGHFHAALVQKSMYRNVDSTVHVYAPEGSDVQQHLDRISSYNNRYDAPTNWKENAYIGPDFLEKMLKEKKGNVVVLAGNNENKTKYIKNSIDAGLNVLADKPMAINQKNFELLKMAFSDAAQKKLLLYDIMTERHEITNRLQRAFAGIPEVFGVIEPGGPDNPGVEMESVHFFYKYVSGKVLIRPSWSMDVLQQGEAITDVATHLVDLVQWVCFPDQVINYQKDIELQNAKRWSTDMTLSEFETITLQHQIPGYLKKDIINDTIIKIFANGSIQYKLNGVHVKVTARWDYKAPEGSADTHYSILRGSKANLVIRQGVEQNFKPTLYIEPLHAPDSVYLGKLEQKVKLLQVEYPGVELKKTQTGWEVIIPEKYKEGHEAHFAMVMEKFLSYLKKGSLPDWEVPNMLAKYYTTTQALELAKKSGTKK